MIIFMNVMLHVFSIRNKIPVSQLSTGSYILTPCCNHDVNIKKHLSEHLLPHKA